MALSIQLQTHLMYSPLVCRHKPHVNTLTPARCLNSTSTQNHSVTAAEPAAEQRLRLSLGSRMPNTLLLEGQRLPDLYTSRHFVNLTNGLDLLPLLDQLQLPFSAVRIRSTSLEQQAYESLLLELDANLLLALALGHSCIVWDTGCRNRKTGAPRALWYGLEFIRFALNRSWCHTHGSSSSNGSSDKQRGGGGDDDGDGSVESSSSSSKSTSSSKSRRSSLLQAHIRGHDVSRDFEAACRSLQPSTKTRLRYYKRYVSPQVQQQGVRLTGAFRGTDRDEDVQHLVSLAQRYCGPPHHTPTRTAADSSSNGLQEGSVPLMTAGQKQEGGRGVVSGGGALSEASLLAYQVLDQEGIGLFASGLSHNQFRQLQQV